MKRKIIEYLIIIMIAWMPALTYLWSATGDPVLVPGSTGITTLGTIATGTWGATDVAVAHGGTGASDAATARSNLSAAVTGANGDITSMTNLDNDGIPVEKIDSNIERAIQGDSTKGRIVRGSYLTIEDGTDASTLKCTLTSRWNGDTIAATDNVAKNATTGNFTLSADGKELIIETTGITGDTVYAIGYLTSNASGTALLCLIKALNNDISIIVYDTTTGTSQDMTGLVDTGAMIFEVIYITDA